MTEEKLENLLAASAEQEFGGKLAGIMSKEACLVYDTELCVVAMLENLLNYGKTENCGKCIPCREGSGEMHNIVQRILKGDARENDVDNLKSLAETSHRGSDCSFGEIMGKIVLKAIEKNRAEFEDHINAKATCKEFKYTTMHYTPCQVHCPLKTDIAYFIHAISLGSFTESRSYLDCVNYFPKTLGLVCGICKELCTLKDDPSGPIDINGLKSFVCDMPYRKSHATIHYERASYSLSHATHLVKKDLSKSQRVAVVGMGPAGLSSTLFLLRKGYYVEGFDMYDQIGGLTLTAIPPDRLPKDILLKELNRAVESGEGRFKLSLNTKIGRDISLETLEKEFDAVLLSPGNQKVTPLKLLGFEETKEGILNFMDFLEKINTGKLTKSASKIGVIGGGNSAMDTATAGMKVGSDVTVYYRKTREMMPADPHEYDIAVNSGVKFEFRMTPKEYVHRGGKIIGMRFENHEGKLVFREMGAAIPAIGQYQDLSILPAKHSFKLTDRGALELNDSGQSSNDRVFAAGDFRYGRTVVHSMAEGVEAALAIDKRLNPTEHDAEDEKKELLKRKILNIAKTISGEDPYAEDIRELWNFSMKPAMRAKKEKSRIEAAVREAHSCMRCRQLIVVAQKI